MSDTQTRTDQQRTAWARDQAADQVSMRQARIAQTQRALERARRELQVAEDELQVAMDACGDY